jgi:hypothetical protein
MEKPVLSNFIWEIQDYTRDRARCTLSEEFEEADGTDCARTSEIGKQVKFELEIIRSLIVTRAPISK